MVKFGVAPAIVEEEIIDSIRKRVHNGAVFLPPLASFESGQIIRINHGPFHGLEAIFEQNRTEWDPTSFTSYETMALQGRMVIGCKCVVL